MFDKGDRVIFNPKVATLPKYKEYEEYIRPGIFEVIDSNDDYSFIEDDDEEGMSFPNEMLLKIPLYHIGDEVIVNAEDYDGHPFGVTGDMEQLNGKKFKIRARHSSAYKVENLGEDGYKYIINEPDCFKWASTDLEKVIIEKDTDVLVDGIMDYVANNDFNTLKEQIKQINNQLKKEENENRLQEKRIPEPNGVSNYEGGIPSRAYKTRIAVCNLVHQTGIRGQKSKT